MMCKEKQNKTAKAEENGLVPNLFGDSLYPHSDNIFEVLYALCVFFILYFDSPSFFLSIAKQRQKKKSFVFSLDMSHNYIFKMCENSYVWLCCV